MPERGNANEWILEEHEVVRKKSDYLHNNRGHGTIDCKQILVPCPWADLFTDSHTRVHFGQRTLLMRQA